MIATREGGELDLGPRPVERGEVVGRYVVLGRVGVGGMGEVHAAFDPELDRKVAIKVLRPQQDGAESGDGHRGLLREARAMAKLDHPNVVAVHDVGEHDGTVFIAMDFIEGRTLARWLAEEQPGWREVLDVFVRAGRGLSAAHERDLVHRDFKPDNVMIDERGRVRVMDFGLARPHFATEEHPASQAMEETAPAGDASTFSGALAGTPAYMAPEQFASLGAGPAADQFSYCVSLWEALYRQRPFSGESLAELAANVGGGGRRAPPSGTRVPRWLRRAVERGLAPEPEQRFERMDALLRTLQRGRARARTRNVVMGFGVLALLGAGAAGMHRYERAQTAARCEAEGAKIRTVWNDERRAILRQALVDTTVSYAAVTADKVSPWFDDHAREWAEARTAACRHAFVGNSWDADTLDRSVWCLDEVRMSLDALLAELARGEARAVVKAIPAAAALRRASPCIDTELLSRLPAPPTDHRGAVQGVRSELSRARALLHTAAYQDGVRVAKEALADAEAIGWPPLTAASRLLVGRLLERTGTYAEAEAELENAYFAAVNAGVVRVAADAANQLVFVVGSRLQRHTDGIRWSRLADVQSSVLPDPADVRLADNLDHLAAVRNAMGDFAAARDLHEQVRGIREEVLGSEHPRLAQTLSDLASVHRAMGAYAEAKALLERALGIWERALGSEHPQVATGLNNLANVLWQTGAYAEAQALLERSLAIRERTDGPEHPHVAATVTNLAAIRVARADHAAALRLYERALSIRKKALGPEHADVGESLSNLAAVYERMGALDKAQQLNEQALRIREETLGAEHPDVARILQNLALVLTKKGALAEARPLYERALSIRVKALGPEHPDVAETLNQFADSQSAVPARAQPMYERALRIRVKALGPEHPTVARSLNGLGSVLQAAGKHLEAQPLYERSLAIQERALGREHPLLAVPLLGLARVSLATGRATAAVAFAERAVGVREAGSVGARPLAQAQFLLARVLWDAGQQRSRALRLARRARDAYRDAGAAQADAVDKWLARRGPQR